MEIRAQKFETMKQCTTNKPRRYNNSLLASHPFNEDEIEVADILIDLLNLIPKSEARRRGELPLSWVVRKKRSVPTPREEVVVVVETEETIRPRVKVESTSPSTPLCFYPSESDDKSKHPNKINLKKRTREELLEMIEGLTRTRELMRVEVENERNRCKKLKSLNLSLKAKKQEVSYFGFKKEKPGLGIMGKEEEGLNLELKLDQQPNQNPMFAHYQQQQLIINHSIYESQAASGRFKFSNQNDDQVQSSNGGGSRNHVGPLGIPDLNVGLEEVYGGMDYYQPLDRNRVFMDDRVMCAAQARRRRMIKIKEIKKRQQQQRVR